MGGLGKSGSNRLEKGLPRVDFRGSHSMYKWKGFAGAVLPHTNKLSQEN